MLDISVVLCTYNRSDMLAGALESVLAQDLPSDKYEVIVVDNNSPDDTRRVVESLIARGHANLHYLFERKQGLSHARNTGIATARAPIVTFTDDDIRAAPDWVSSVRQAFAEHPEVDLVGGKVLPRWNAPPPSWLTHDHWAPLAIVDEGDQVFHTNKKRQFCLIGANLSVRRALFNTIGPFLADFQRVKDGIGSTEDHEFQLRCWRAGKQGLYRPDVIVTADVQNERLSKTYHRRWHTGHGAFSARMRVGEVPPNAVTLFGVPDYFYLSLLRTVVRWLCSSLTPRSSDTLCHEMALRYSISYIQTTYGLTRSDRQHVGSELFDFARRVIRKKFRALVGRLSKRPL